VDPNGRRTSQRNRNISIRIRFRNEIKRSFRSRIRDAAGLISGLAFSQLNNFRDSEQYHRLGDEALSRFLVTIQSADSRGQ